MIFVLGTSGLPGGNVVPHRRDLGLTQALAEVEALLIRTHAAMVSGDLVDVLKVLVERRALISDGLVQAVRESRQCGMTWEEIADAMGTTKQNVWASYRVYTQEYDHPRD